MVLLLAVAAGSLEGCAGRSGAAGRRETGKVVRVGYFPNITHAQVLVGVARGTFQERLGPETRVEFKVLNAGPSAIEALFAGELDLVYIGPNPAVNGYVRSGGQALRIVAGGASGGASLVVRGNLPITRPADFRGRRIASPQLGNTQDVALRWWLKEQGLGLKGEGGDVEVIPVKNPDQLALFLKQEIDAAWTVEPWVSRLVREGGGRVFLDERELWPEGKFVTTILVASSRFLREEPGLLKKWLQAHVELALWIQGNPAAARELVNRELERLTGKPLSREVLEDSFSRLEITYDPVRESLFSSADRAYELGFLGRERPDLSAIYDLTLLNQVLIEKGLATGG